MKKILLVLLVALALIRANAQGQLVRGKVTDDNNRPLPGATVTLKGTTVSTTTDTTGSFQINTGSQIDPVLVVSYVGYLNREFPVRGRSQITINLQQDQQTLGDVVVVGYGVQRKSDITGASSSIKAAEIAKRPLVRLEQALQGTTSGVAVTSPNGQPGQGLRVKVRGANSITGSTEPLYVIDGNIGSGTDVNPADVESLEVLKDAASTAIYGSRASNGVVLITTRSGSSGKPKIGFSGWARHDQIPRELDLMQPYDFARSVNAQFAATGNSAAFTDQQLADLKSGKTPGTDWQKALHKTAWVQNYQLDLSGGSDAVRYYFSLGYLDQPGIILNQWFKKTTFRANVDVKVNSRLNVRFIVTGIVPRNHNTNYGGGLGDPFNQAAEWDPTSPIRDASGNFINHSPYASIQFNPIAQALNQRHDNMDGNNALTNNYSGSVILTYRLLKDLTFTSTNVYNLGYGYSQSLDGPGTSAYDARSDNAFTIAARNRGFLSSNFLTYKHSFGDHTINATALYELQNGQNMSTTATARNLISYGNGYYNLGLGATQSVSSSYSADALVSWMGRVYYSFRDRYTISASLRADGSSHLTNKWSSFPSIGANWNIKKEKFLEDSRLFSDLRIRASYGQTGNQSVPPYSTIPLLQTNANNQPAYYFGGGTPGASGTPSIGVTPGAPVSKTLKWEIKKTYDAGVDFGFLNGRLTLTIDAYTSRIENLLYNRPSSQYIGGQNYQANIGTLSNKGFEFSIGGTPVSNRDFRWNTNLTFSLNRNKILSLGGLDNLYSIGGNNTFNAMLKVGQPLGEFTGYKFLGTWKTKEASEAAAVGYKPGDPKYVDVNGDNKFTQDDFLPLGNATPSFTYGIINDIGYQDFTLSFMFQGQQGSKVFSQTLAYLWGGPGDMKNATIAQAVPENLWSPQHETDNPWWGASKGSYSNATSRFIYNSSYAKLKNISLTWRVPSNVSRRLKLNNLEVYVSGQNLWVITPYKGYDPEIDNQPTGNAISQGQEFGVIPNPKSYTFGLRLSL